MELSAAKAKEIKETKANEVFPVQEAVKNLVSDISGKAYALSCDGRCKYDDLISSTLNNSCNSFLDEDVKKICALTKERLSDLGYYVEGINYMCKHCIKFDKWKSENNHYESECVYTYCFHINISWQ